MFPMSLSRAYLHISFSLAGGCISMTSRKISGLPDIADTNMPFCVFRHQLYELPRRSYRLGEPIAIAIVDQSLYVCGKAGINQWESSQTKRGYRPRFALAQRQSSSGLGREEPHHVLARLYA